VLCVAPDAHGRLCGGLIPSPTTPRIARRDEQTAIYARAGRRYGDGHGASVTRCNALAFSVRLGEPPNRVAWSRNSPTVSLAGSMCSPRRTVSIERTSSACASRSLPLKLTYLVVRRPVRGSMPSSYFNSHTASANVTPHDFLPRALRLGAKSRCASIMQ